MTQESNNDQKLVDFLKQNQSCPLTNNLYQEEKLMNLISSNSLQSLLPAQKYLWIVSSAITMGFLLLFGNLVKNNFAPQMVQEQENIETFMINAWQGSMLEQIDESEFQQIKQKDWLFVTENNLLYSEP